MMMPPGAPPGLAPGGPPPGLAALIAHAQASGPGDADDKGPVRDGGLGVLQDIITDFPRLLHALSDPADVQLATQALHILTKVQQALMSRGGGNGPSPPGQ
jgi:hypothetical protein